MMQCQIGSAVSWKLKSIKRINASKLQVDSALLGMFSLALLNVGRY